MRQGINQATIRVFEPNELAPEDKERLLGTLESFVNLGDGLQEFERFGRQNPEFFPIRIVDNGQRSTTPLPPPAFQGITRRWEDRKLINGKPQGGKKVTESYWIKMLAWEPACQSMFLLYRDALRETWPRPGVVRSRLLTGRAFLVLLGIEPSVPYKEWQAAFDSIRSVYPKAKPILAEVSRLVPDAQTGTFDYLPDNDFHKAVYILFRESWRAKTCQRCSRRFLADKPRRVYCSTNCSAEVMRKRGNDWWNAHGKRWRAKREAKNAGAGSRKKSASHKRIAKGAK